MNILWQIINREFVSNVLTARFIIGLSVCLISTSVSVWVQVDDYEKRLLAYNTAVREARIESKTWDTYDKISPKAHRKPNPFSVFSLGAEKAVGDTIDIKLGAGIWRGETHKRGMDNPFLSMFLAVDVIFIFKIVLSALAILFAYDTISGEREDGTLKLVLSNAIPRGTLVLGKYFGGMLSLFPILVISSVTALLIAYSSLYISFDRNDLMHLALVFVVSLLYMSTWYLLSLLVSIWTKEAASTLILSVFLWVLLTIVHSNVTTFVVMKFPPYRFDSENFQQIPQLWDDFKRERDEYVKNRGYNSPQDAISWPADAISSGGVGVSSEFGWSFRESYTVNNVSNADVSMFREILGYQEPLRIRYADRVEEIFRGWDIVNEKIEHLSRDISRFSFANVYEFAVESITGTGPEIYSEFIGEGRSYKREVINYLRDKRAFSSRTWFSSDQGVADLVDLPVFQQRPRSLTEGVSRAAADIFILFTWNIILFFGAYVSFLRYDMS